MTLYVVWETLSPPFLYSEGHTACDAVSFADGEVAQDVASNVRFLLDFAFCEPNIYGVCIRTAKTSRHSCPAPHGKYFYHALTAAALHSASSVSACSLARLFLVEKTRSIRRTN